MQTQVIIMWALIESAALFGIVLHFLSGTPSFLYSAVGFLIVCALIFFPRREWFEGLS